VICYAGVKNNFIIMFKSSNPDVFTTRYISSIQS